MDQAGIIMWRPIGAPLCDRMGVSQESEKVHTLRGCKMWSGAGMVAICLAIPAGCAELPGEAVRQIRHADQSYRLARFAESERLASRVIDAHPDKPDTAEAYYIRGLSRLRLGQRSSAASDFEVGLRRCEREELSVLLSLQVGNMAYEAGVYGRAATFLGRAVTKLPTSAPGDETWYRYAHSLQRSGDFAHAGDAFHRVLTDYGNSPSARDALRNVSWRQDYFTLQCGAYSRRRAAGDAAEQLRLRGLVPTVTKLRDRGSVQYIVHVGRYRDFGAAWSALPAVRSVQPDAFILP